MYSYQERVEDLRSVTGNCPNLAAVATPYIEASDWENETGKKISDKVGTNGLFDMCAAVDKLTQLGRSCVGCTQSGESTCPLNGVSRLTLEETLVLID